MGGAVTDYQSGNIPFDPELYKLAAQRTALESGASLLLHSYISGCITDKNDSNKSPASLSKQSGRQVVEAKYIIDCTGDADIVKFAGFAIQDR